MNAEISIPKNEHHRQLLELKDKVIVTSGLTEEGNDVLSANSAFDHLPILIEERNAAAIQSMTEILGLRAHRLIKEGSLDSEGQRIAQRDLSKWVTASTLVPHMDDDSDLYSAEEVPEASALVPIATQALVKLSDSLGVPPRTTDENYAHPENPRWLTRKTMDLGGVEVRGEAFVKVCVGDALQKQEATIARLLTLSEIDIDSPEFVETLGEAKRDFSRMVAAIGLVKHDMDLTYFMKDLMPLFKVYSVNGRKYRHSGSENVVMHDLDYLMWSADSNDPKFADYRQNHLVDATERQKAEFAKLETNLAGHGSLINQVLTSVSGDLSSVSMGELEKVSGIYGVIAEIEIFRTAHCDAITKSLAFRPGKVSSGEDFDMAYDLRDETQRQLQRLKPYYKEHRRRMRDARLGNN